MDELITPALVLRRSEYSDNDRMLTLLTPEHGCVEAIARGCRKPKSHLMGAAELFASGEYTLIARGGRQSVKQCQLSECFYPLREDLDRLCHGAYWLALLRAAAQPDQPCEALFALALRALAHLAYDDSPPEMLTLGFELHYLTILGMAPRADACVLCANPVGSAARFDAEAGGVLCDTCGSGAARISDGVRRILLRLPRLRYDAVPRLKASPDWPEAAYVARDFLRRRVDIDRALPPLPPLSKGEGETA